MDTTKSLILSLFFLLPSWIIAQEIVDNNKQWSIATIHCQPWGNAYSTQFYKFEGDTTIESITYKKVMIASDELHENWEFFGAFIREENGQTFYRELYQEEGLIYDFNLEVGDTALINNTRAFESVHLVLTEIDSISSEEGYVERWQLSCIEYPNLTETWLRGIGSMAGVINSSVEIFGGLCGLYKLLCSSEYNQTVFQNPEFEGCYLYITNIENQQETISPIVYFSQQEHKITINTSSSKESTITLTRLNGQVLDHFKIQSEKIHIPVSVKHKGIILVTVKQGSFTTTQKVLIQ